MKRITLIFVFVALLHEAQSQQIVYLVTYDSARVIVQKKCLNLTQVKTLFGEKLKALENGGVYFDFYVEKKKVGKNGKLKRIRK